MTDAIQCPRAPAQAGAHHGTARYETTGSSAMIGQVMGSCLRGGMAAFSPIVLAIAAIPATAQDRLPPAPYAYEQLKDPVKEARAKALMDELRCLVCQGQSIADSDAPLAGDMRHEVRSKIAAGESSDAIKQWLVARYGNWVSYDPPFDAATAFLWLGPFLFLLLGGWLAYGRFQRGGDEAGEGEA